ncbi:phage antirepressor KilAC domain-containing protein [Weissella viridescens]|uniref:phage antirepressor KilAC domain-containing protein n=1 Tax=Weissella viridescens TaxID=1629 RepID=UPI00092F7C4A|nr:phage antirepressor KilAC domain-containing protein [Weissella viridescens]
MDNELINIQTNEQGEQRVSARELHRILGLKKKFTDWWKQYSEMFIEGTDWTTSPKSEEVQNNGGVQVRVLDDYSLSVDMAKHISMMTKTERGNQIRDYFIQIEKQWNSPELMMARSLQYANNKLIGYESKIAELTPKAELHDKFIATGEAIGVREASKEMGIKQTDLVDILMNNRYIYREQGRNGKLQPYKKYVPKLFVLKSGGVGENGIEFTPRMRITPYGREYFYKKFVDPEQTELDMEA